MSYAAVERNEVIKACESYLAKRAARIEREREEMIQAKMTGWFRAKTREIAIKRLDAGRAFSEWNLIELTGAMPAYTVKQLLKLAQIASDVVMVDDEAARILKSYFEEKK